MRGSVLKYAPWLAALFLLGRSVGADADDLATGGVWVIGDSIGVGIAAALKRADVLVESHAEVSTNARQWRMRVSNMPSSWRFVVISLGTNDAQSAELRREFAGNIAAIAAELRERGHVVCLLLPPSEHSAIPSQLDYERLDQVANLLVVRETVDMADKWHPTAAGYDRLAYVVEQIRRQRA